MEGYKNETNSTLTASPEINWITISVCIAAIVITVFSLLLSIAIFLDRKAYEKTRSFLLLNYMFNYTLFAFLFYFRYAHVKIFTDLQASGCYAIFILCSVFEDGALYFLIPICYDFIVKYTNPSKHDSQSFLCPQIILTVVLWVFIWIKVLVMMLAYTSHKLNPCQIDLDASALYFHFAIVILYVIVLLVYLGMLINISVNNRGNDDTIVPLRTIITVVLVTMILYAIHNILFAVMYGGLMAKLFYSAFLIFLIKFIVVPFLWLSDPTIKQSIRTLCSRKCQSSDDFSPNELTKLN
ncbi:uncharacterized protein LOC115220942 isoform X3 [Octopus sinensis]|uniref:Uncharacterized protein LOC115220942 isoform X3 n=1 Tax=Octopus sinensis TaxID=2607531 RepID=A0A7E6FEV4_9MOLL|nr:uncharacterized protein LOC115220942 isoform X3 [Octopus sinensis]